MPEVSVRLRATEGFEPVVVAQPAIPHPLATCPIGDADKLRSTKRSVNDATATAATYARDPMAGA